MTRGVREKRGNLPSSGSRCITHSGFRRPPQGGFGTSHRVIPSGDGPCGEGAGSTRTLTSAGPRLQGEPRAGAVTRRCSRSLDPGSPPSCPPGENARLSKAGTMGERSLFRKRSKCSSFCSPQNVLKCRNVACRTWARTDTVKKP